MFLLITLQETDAVIFQRMKYSFTLFLRGYFQVFRLFTLESLGFVRTLAPVNDDHTDTGLYIGTTKNFVLDGAMHDKFRALIQVKARRNFPFRIMV